jgi:hypothetical protein
MLGAIEYFKSKKLLVGLLAALVSFQLPLTWVVCAYYFPGYDSVAQSLSELSADDSPVKWVVRSSVIFQAALITLIALTLTSIARVGKILLLLAALFMLASALVSSPSQTDYSPAHRVASFLAFALGCLWPAFSTHRGENIPISRSTGILISLGFLAFTLVGWSFWAFASHTYFGILQRLNILGQAMFLGWYWWNSFRKQD